MTREQAKRMLPFMLAYAEGKTIQFRAHINDEWRDVKELVLNGFTGEYRIKPELKCRPFESKEECWKEMHKHPDFGWVKVNGNVTCEYEQIIRIVDYRKTELTFNIANSDDVYTPEMMLNTYIFTDGKPFGVKE